MAGGGRLQPPSRVHAAADMTATASQRSQRVQFYVYSHACARAWQQTLHACAHVMQATGAARSARRP
jgi:hypothetical protein